MELPSHDRARRPRSPMGRRNTTVPSGRILRAVLRPHASHGLHQRAAGQLRRILLRQPPLAAPATGSHQLSPHTPHGLAGPSESGPVPGPTIRLPASHGVPAPLPWGEPGHARGIWRHGRPHSSSTVLRNWGGRHACLPDAARTQHGHGPRDGYGTRDGHEPGYGHDAARRLDVSRGAAAGDPGDEHGRVREHAWMRDGHLSCVALLSCCIATRVVLVYYSRIGAHHVYHVRHRSNSSTDSSLGDISTVATQNQPISLRRTVFSRCRMVVHSNLKCHTL